MMKLNYIAIDFETANYNKNSAPVRLDWLDSKMELK